MKCREQQHSLELTNNAEMQTRHSSVNGHSPETKKMMNGHGPERDEGTQRKGEDMHVTQDGGTIVTEQRMK